MVAMTDYHIKLKAYQGRNVFIDIFVHFPLYNFLPSSLPVPTIFFFFFFFRVLSNMVDDQ